MQALDGRGGYAPPIPLDIRNEVRCVVDLQDFYAERIAALAKIWYELNECEVGTLGKCIMADPPFDLGLVAKAGFEPATRGFSGRCSTN